MALVAASASLCMRLDRSSVEATPDWLAAGKIFSSATHGAAVSAATSTNTDFAQ
jgi:hypothetical protein